MKITLSKNKEPQISSSFEETKVNFSYPNDLCEFIALNKGDFQRDSQIDKEKLDDNDKNVVLGETRKSDKFIVIDDVSGLFEKSNDCGSFCLFQKKNWLHLYLSFPHFVSIKI